MTNDQTVNGIPCLWERLPDGSYQVEFIAGQREERKAKELVQCDVATFGYCDQVFNGIVGEIVWRIL